MVGYTLCYWNNFSYIEIFNLVYTAMNEWEEWSWSDHLYLIFTKRVSVFSAQAYCGWVNGVEGLSGLPFWRLIRPAYQAGFTAAVSGGAAACVQFPTGLACVWQAWPPELPHTSPALTSSSRAEVPVSVCFRLLTAHLFVPRLLSGNCDSHLASMGSQSGTITRVFGSRPKWCTWVAAGGDLLSWLPVGGFRV